MVSMGCYYTVTSLYAFGKLDGELEAVTQDGDRIELTLSDSEEGDESTTYAMILRQDKVFRESLIASCISKLNLSTDSRILPEGKYLKNEEGAIERFKEFYIKELHTKKVTKGLLDRYNIPVVVMGTPALQEIHKLYVN